MTTCPKCLCRKARDEFYGSGRRSGYCKDCSRQYAREWRQRNPERYAAQKRNRTPATKRRNSLLRRGITPQRYDEMYAAQEGLCAVCTQPRPLVVDHDGTCCPTNVMGCGRCVRGLLCKPCNFLLGLAQEQPQVLLAAARYLTAKETGR